MHSKKKDVDKSKYNLYSTKQKYTKDKYWCDQLLNINQ